MVTLQTFTNRFDAEELRMLLEGSGIASKILSDDAGGVNPVLASVFGVRVLVSESDLAEGQTLIKSISENQKPANYEHSARLYPILFKSIKLVWWVVFAYLTIAVASKFIFDQSLGDRGLIVFLFLSSGALILTLIYAMLKSRTM